MGTVNMSDIEWDVDDFEPPPNKAPAATDKWEGEDEEEEIRDNWDDEDEERERSGDPTSSAPAKSKKKKLADKIAEKEAKQQEEIEKRRKELEDKSRTETPEEKLEEKLRLQKIQEDADLELANDLVGSTVEEGENKVLDEIDLSDRDGLQSFRKALVAKIRSTDRLEKRPFFVNFVEELSRDLCENLELEEVKRVSSVLNSLYNEKVKASKPKSKKKGNKPKLNVAQGAIIDIGNDYGAEYDDFM